MIAVSTMLPVPMGDFIYTCIYIKAYFLFTAKGVVVLS